MRVWFAVLALVNTAVLVPASWALDVPMARRTAALAAVGLVTSLIGISLT